MERKEPLSYRMRPTELDDFVGQKHILGENAPLRKLINSGRVYNSIYYGPPGCGKTSLAGVIAGIVDCDYVGVNAANISVGEIKEIVKESKNKLKSFGRKTILFLDEIHRFNKLQQDSLLPSTEDGTIILIGATTENPYFSINNALLSRCLVFEFKKLQRDELIILINKAEKELGLELIPEVRHYLCDISDGDARRGINFLELLSAFDGEVTIEECMDIIGKGKVYYNKEQDHYDVISAFIKSIRGSDPDAAVYWLGKMLAGGENPEFIARRLVILASEDIGLANPEALNIAVSCMHAAKMIGMPEIRIILSEATIYMAISSKSNSVYNAINSVLADIEKGINIEVPIHIRQDNKDLYKYPHSYENNFIYQDYLGTKKKYYEPCNNKNELLIKEKLKKLWGGKDG